MPRISQVKEGQSDAALKEAGVWHEFRVPDCPEPVKLKLRSIASNAARLWEIKVYREQRNYYENDGLPPIDVIDQNEINKLAEALVTDWNLTDDADQPLPRTVAMVREVMKDLPDLRTNAISATAKHEKYRLKAVAALEKNSETPSSQDSATAAGPA
jgi:hypothetical protein